MKENSSSKSLFFAQVHHFSEIGKIRSLNYNTSL